MRVLSTISVAAFVLAAGYNTSVHATSSFRTSNTVEIAGSAWHSSFEEAAAIAEESDKPILHLQMFGELDDEFC